MPKKDMLCLEAEAILRACDVQRLYLRLMPGGYITAHVEYEEEYFAVFEAFSLVEIIEAIGKSVYGDKAMDA